MAARRSVAQSNRSRWEGPIRLTWKLCQRVLENLKLDSISFLPRPLKVIPRPAPRPGGRPKDLLVLPELESLMEAATLRGNIGNVPTPNSSEPE